jgi:hypothetical protein
MTLGAVVLAALLVVAWAVKPALYASVAAGPSQVLVTQHQPDGQAALIAMVWLESEAWPGATVESAQLSGCLQLEPAPGTALDEDQPPQRTEFCDLKPTGAWLIHRSDAGPDPMFPERPLIQAGADPAVLIELDGRRLTLDSTGMLPTRFTSGDQLALVLVWEMSETNSWPTSGDCEYDPLEDGTGWHCDYLDPADEPTAVEVRLRSATGVLSTSTVTLR